MTTRFGASGPPRKPTALKVLEGTFRHDRATTREPASAAIKVPSAPRHLSATERRMWRRLAPMIDKLRVMTAGDVEAFELLVAHLAIIFDARAALKGAESMTYTTSSGAVVQRPELQMIATHSKIAGVYMARFGLSPADRSRVSMLGGEPSGDDLDEFLR
jgi:P27 family predicted phage terminase small subunit